MADKYESVSVVYAFRRSAEYIHSFGRCRAPLYGSGDSPLLLHEYPAVMGRFRRFNAVRHLPLQVRQPNHHLLMLFRCNHVFRHSPPRWYKEEHAPEHRPHPFDRFRNSRQIVQVITGHRRVDLNRNLQLL
ncbi:hypothetical protein D3C81_1594800 [compost metagenome]